MSLPEFRIIIDTREQKPYRIAGAEFGALAAGDYSIQGLETKFAIERKSLKDAWASIGKNHERFKREVQIGSNFLSFVVLVEAPVYKFMDPFARGCLVKPSSLAGTVRKWREAYGIQWVFARDAKAGKKFVEWQLRQWWEEYRANLWIMRKGA